MLTRTLFTALVLLALLLAGCQAVPSLIEPREPELPHGEAAQSRIPEHWTPARVQRVVDGDTIQVSVEGQYYTVRYIGIDSPETVRPDHPVEWMGPEATAANEALVGGKMVYLEKDVSETDRYGRLLRYVYLADGTMVNAELVRQGYAYSSTYPPDVKYQELLNRSEREAREAGRGLWGPQP
jgi:micrococcal nuclease